MSKVCATDVKFISLAKLMKTGRAANHPVAMLNDKLYSWGDFFKVCSSLAYDLSKSSKTRWCLYCEDTFSFAVGLMALLHSGKIAVLPQNAQEGRLLELKPYYDGIISDISFKSVPAEQIHPLALCPTQQFSFDNLAPESPAIELFTSGSTGEPQRVSKQLSHLADEVAGLETCFSDRLNPAVVYSTVSHQHIYGLLFRLLWPLCAGRPFYSSTVVFPEQLMMLFEKNEAACLISSPTHLKRMPGLIDLHKFHNLCPVVYSSGGKLSERTALSFYEQTGQAPIEVLGSTETGGVAWRQITDKPSSYSWTVFDSVEIRCAAKQNSLMVKSPYLSIKTEDGWFSMGDEIKLISDNQFILLNRIDRIVKVEGKRVSLNEVEDKLSSHRFVKEVKVVSLSGAVFSARDVLGVVIILKSDGFNYKTQRGSRALSVEFQTHLKRYFEPVVVPRLWRYVESFPENAQGKVPFHELVKLFYPEDSSKLQGLELLKEELTDSSFKACGRVKEDLWCFPDHFPGQALVPGYVQLLWVNELARKLKIDIDSPETVEALKFHNALLPKTEFDITLNWQEDKKSLSFTFKRQSIRYLSGRFRYCRGATC